MARTHKLTDIIEGYFRAEDGAAVFVIDKTELELTFSNADRSLSVAGRFSPSELIRMGEFLQDMGRRAQQEEGGGGE